MTEPSKAPSGPTYWIEWCRYSRREDGCRTHAVADPGTGRALCGVTTSDCGGGTIPLDGTPGCIRCRKALVKLGILPHEGVYPKGEVHPE